MQFYLISDVHIRIWKASNLEKFQSVRQQKSTLIPLLEALQKGHFQRRKHRNIFRRLQLSHCKRNPLICKTTLFCTYGIRLRLKRCIMIYTSVFRRNLQNELVQTKSKPYLYKICFVSYNVLLLVI